MKRTTAGFLAITLLALLSTGAWAKGKGVLEGTLNMNTATAEELVQLPGIGKAKAEAIIAYRESHPFKAVSELAEVKGVGPKMMEKIQGFLTIDGVTTLRVVEPSARAEATPSPVASK